MEMEQREVEVVMKKRRVIFDKSTHLEKAIKILNLQHFMWTQKKQNYDKHIKRMENQKDIATKKDQASKVGFLMGWEILMSNVMLEFLNTFLIKGVDIYFGHKDKVYVSTNN